MAANKISVKIGHTHTHVQFTRTYVYEKIELRNIHHLYYLQNIRRTSQWLRHSQ